jgi:hypothetical protein
MSRLHELADMLWRGQLPDNERAETIGLLRAAAAETVGTEWLPTGDGSVFVFDCGNGSAQTVRLRSNTEAAIVQRRHEADLAAARLAIAAARKERDEALARVAELEAAALNAACKYALSSEHSPTALAMWEAIRHVVMQSPPTVAENATVAKRNPDTNPDTVSGSPVKGPDLSKVGVFGPGCSPHPLDRATPTEPRQWRREYYSDRRFWMSWLDKDGQRYTVLTRPIMSSEGSTSCDDDTWCLPYIKGDTLATLPPLPTEPTPAVSPCCRELLTRVEALERLTQELASAHASDPAYAIAGRSLDLVARLAEEVRPLIPATQVGGINAIIREARKETT